MQELVKTTKLPKEQKDGIISEMENTVIRTGKKKTVVFKKIKDAVSISLRDNEFITALREVNEAIVAKTTDNTGRSKLKP